MRTLSKDLKMLLQGLIAVPIILCLAVLILFAAYVDVMGWPF